MESATGRGDSSAKVNRLQLQVRCWNICFLKTNLRGVFGGRGFVGEVLKQTNERRKQTLSSKTLTLKTRNLAGKHRNLM